MSKIIIEDAAVQSKKSEVRVEDAAVLSRKKIHVTGTIDGRTQIFLGKYCYRYML